MKDTHPVSLLIISWVPFSDISNNVASLICIESGSILRDENPVLLLGSGKKFSRHIKTVSDNSLQNSGADPSCCIWKDCGRLWKKFTVFLNMSQLYMNPGRKKKKKNLPLNISNLSFKCLKQGKLWFSTHCREHEWVRWDFV